MSPTGFFQNSWSFWLIIPAFFLLLLEIIFRKKWKGSLFFFRLIWICLLAGIMAEWMLVTSRELSHPELLHVVLDGSDSVVKLPQRLERLQLFLSEIEEWSENTHQPIRYVTFGDSLKEGVYLQGGEKTLLGPVGEQLDGRVLLLSDGLWTDHARFLGPTFTVQLGDAYEKDMWVEELPPILTAFLKNRIKIPVRIKQVGFQGRLITARLYQGNQLLEEKKITLEKEEMDVTFQYFPEKMGDNLFYLELQTLEGELTALNNWTTFRIRTVRDKIRVLHIAGKPSYDARTLRLFLTRQPDVDLVSFYILRSLEDSPEAKDYELSLIPFPYEELFSTELQKFDLVILHNFNFHLYFQPIYLLNLVRFIQEGGGLLMMGGDQSFHHYRISPLAPLLPFQFTSNQVGAWNFRSQELHRGMVHPITEGLEEIFQKVSWSHGHDVASNSESSLLFSWTSGQPFLSVRPVERGRVAAFNTDELWKIHVHPTLPGTAYQQLLRRVFQYLTFDPDMELHRLQSSSWHVKQPVTLSFSDHEKGSWTVQSFPKKQFSKTYQNLSTITYTPEEAGLYEVSHSLLDRSVFFETEERPWRGEWKNVNANNTQLKNISQQSGGQFFTFQHREKALNHFLSGRQIIVDQTQSWRALYPILTWGILFLTLFFMCIDFYLRKKHQWDV